MTEENKDEEFVAGTNLQKGRDKADAANKLRLHLMRRQGRSFKDAAESAAHEMQHMSNVPKDKRVRLVTNKQGRAFVKPQDPLTMHELYKMSTAVGEANMNDVDKRNAKLAKFFMWLDKLFKKR